MRPKMRILFGCLLLASAPLAHSQTAASLDTQVRVLDNTAASRGQSQVAQKIASSFTRLAGSADNALALVDGLRSGSAINLKTSTTTGTSATPVTSTTTTTITPPTGAMGWGNVRIALALAQDSLARAGITNPTAQQLQAALVGGT